MEYKLRDLVSIKYGKNQKKVINKNGKYPILGTGGVMGFANDYLYDKESVLIGRKGSIGSVKFINKPFWTIDTLFYTVINEKLIIPKFLFYKLSLIDFNFYNEGTTIPSLRTETLYKIKVDIPGLKKQQKIVSILNIFDEKITNNQKIIANLEELSQTLFKHWFVDFEFPDENGNPYKSSGGEMVESELGEIPKGWEVKELKDIVKQKKETFNPKKADVLEALHFSLPAFDNGQTPVLDNTKTIKSNKWILNENCCLFSKMNPKTPRIWLPQVSKQYLNIASSEFVVLESNNLLKNSFIYNVCQSKGFNEYLVTHTTGSTNSRQRVKPQVAMEYQLPFNEKLTEEYGEKIASISEKIINNRKENENLTKLRDTLLPKLMSGEIEISDDVEVDEDELQV